MKRIIITAIWVISMFHVVSIEAQAPGCPSINAGPDQNVDCTNPCVTLTATVLATGTTGSYSVSSIPYAPPAAYGGGTGVTVHADDMWSGVITLPFPFCFYGNQYTQVVTGSNAITSFELSYAGAFCPWDQRTQGTIPTSNYPINSIMWPYEDVDNSSTGDFTYELIGTAPCRMLVVSATNIPYYGGVNSINTSFCTSPPIYATSMLVLYETTNVIEIYNQNKYVCSGWNDGYAIEGIQDATGANAAFVPGRNNTQWTATNDAWRFTPNGTPNYTVTWWQGATQIASGISTTVCPTSTTTYTAQVVYNLCPGGQLTLTDDVVVNAVITAPTPTITGTLSICSGSSTTLDAGSPYSSYSWSNSANTQTITVSPVVTTTYTVTVTNSSGCSGTASVVVNVNSLTPAITGPLSVCSGSSTTLDAGGPYSTYSWSNSANTQIITVSPVIATTYTVTVVNGSGCTGTASVVVSINPNLSPAITGISSICSGSTTTLDAGGPYFSYSWSNSANTQTTSVSPVVNTTYTVTVSNGSGCTGTASEAVAVNVNPTPTIIGPPSICSGSSTTLDAGGGFSSYSWSNSANTQTTTVSPVVATTYTVTVSTAAGCTGSTSIAINISANLTPAISGPLSVCSGSSTTLDAGGPYSTYSWSNSANTQIITVSPVVATTYTVTVSNGSGCTGTASVVVNINPNLTPAITGILSICSGNSTTLDAGGPYSTYSWSNSANTQIITVSPVVATTYTVTVSNGSGCTGTASEAVTINPNPTPPTITGPSSICSGTTTTLDAGGGYSNYSWSNSAITQTITVSPVVATTYTVTVTNGSGCTATASEAVTMNP
ncbi:MAG: hypothetical protein ABR968_07255, partial [Bacteroidales bacterium]